MKVGFDFIFNFINIMNYIITSRRSRIRFIMFLNKLFMNFEKNY